MRDIDNRPDHKVPAPAVAGSTDVELPSNAETLSPEPSQGLAAVAPVGQDFGDYELLSEIARGGMGIVYRARQRSLQRTVALKMILEGRLASEQVVQRFHQEARSAAGLDHPNIVPIYEVGECLGRHYFTMALVDGASLAATVRERGLPSAEDAATLVASVAEAVAYAHAQGILHRDLKPDNVLIDRSGRPRVTDFGLARSLTSDSGLTASGQILGTPTYMAPEQATGDSRQLGPATDVYALGGILYFLLTGRPPFAGSHTMEVLYRVLHEPPQPPRAVNPRVPAELEAVCLKCLQKDPADRYSSATEVAAALQPLALTSGGRPVPVTRTPVSQVPAGQSTTAVGTEAGSALPTRRRRRLGATLALAFVAGGGFLAFQHWGKPADKTEAGGSEHQILIPQITHHDFGLKVEMLGATRGKGGELLLREGQAVSFRIEAARDAHVGIWNITPDGTIRQLFPNEYEPDKRVKAGEPRMIPGAKGDDKYFIRAGFSGDLERVWVVASTRPWKTPPGEREGPFVIFRKLEAKRALLRDLFTVPASQGETAEELLAYRVLPRPDRR